MAHAANVQALAELLYRAEHWELGIAPPFERLTAARQEEYRRKARFLSGRGVVVPAAVAEDLCAALALPAGSSPARLQAALEAVVRER